MAKKPSKAAKPAPKKVLKKPVKAAASAKSKKPAVKPTKVVKKLPPKKAKAAFKPVKKAVFAAKKPAVKIKKAAVSKKPAPKAKKAPLKKVFKAAPKPFKATSKKYSPPVKAIKTKQPVKVVKTTEPVKFTPTAKAQKSVKAAPAATALNPVKESPSVKTSKSGKVDASKNTVKVTKPFLPPVKIAAPRKNIEFDDNEIVIPKKSPYSAAFLKRQKQRLFDLRNSLMDAMENVAKDSLRTRPEGSEASAGGMHMADAGSDAYDRDFALSLLSKEQNAVYEINDAIKRLELGSYGICEMTGKPVNEERLEALPFARYTREAMEQLEREQMGGRGRRQPVRSVFGLDEDKDEDEDEDEGTTTPKKSDNESSLDFTKE